MIKIKKIKDYFKRLVWITGEKAPFTLLILLLLALILGSFVFYKYSFLVEKSKPEVTRKPRQFEEAVFQRILKEWQIRQERFEGADLKEYPDLFQSRVQVPKESEELTK